MNSARQEAAALGSKVKLNAVAPLSNMWNCDNILSVLTSLPKPIHLSFVPGNNGDSLIHMGASALLESIGEKSVELKDARSVVIVGHGVFTYREFDSLDGLNPMRTIKQCQDKALVLLPFSTLPGNAKLLAAQLNKRSKPTWVFCRETISKDILQTLLLPEVKLETGHDAAFALATSNFIEVLKSKSKASHVLVVERFDNESATESPGLFKISEKIRALVPESIRRALKSRMLDRIYSSTPFAESIQASLPDDLRELPLMAGDVSQQQNYSFATFIASINEAACVHATRLHVAILAAMLGKPTVLYAGKNHKFKGIYEYSMRDLGHVKLA